MSEKEKTEADAGGRLGAGGRPGSGAPGAAPVKTYTIWELGLLSAFLPGAGQFANGQKGKGLLFAIPSAIVFVDIMVHTFIVTQMVFAPVMAGEPLFVTDEAFNVLKAMLVALGVALVIWLIALVDTILVGRRLRREEEDASD